MSFGEFSIEFSVGVGRSKRKLRKIGLIAKAFSEDATTGFVSYEISLPGYSDTIKRPIARSRFDAVVDILNTYLCILKDEGNRDPDSGYFIDIDGETVRVDLADIFRSLAG